MRKIDSSHVIAANIKPFSTYVKQICGPVCPAGLGVEVAQGRRFVFDFKP